MKELTDLDRIVFIFAHPDDEVYCCVLMNRFVKAGKNISAVFITSGDFGGDGDKREMEARASMKIIGIPKKHVYFLRIPETEIFGKIGNIVQMISEFLQDADCVISHDYEGGHEGHDIASFCASELVNVLNIRSHFVFPVYHGAPYERKGARFKPERKNIAEIKLDEKERNIKEGVLNAHVSQKGHFEGMQKASLDYEKLLFSRELYCKIVEPIDFFEKPMEDVGYEKHRNGFKFPDFRNAIEEYESNKK